ncbi:Dil and ankyrin domain containing protein [Lasiodiplodia theobromae]|uniref:Dilute domain-containing protein n=1 Tax=Lasiodiplodia theobromae TaxID=45133 RepID=A0A5N5DCT3_9PEZI|nr:Dil and ankyrin domain containing protein [Lasiodiplodia theobromae]KAB2575559.1 Dilute domain-containing protein [Lasiodiplodia theobromae]KAF4536334.1 Dil and ankyrin domain containing protein [Lasiodiplodia theobromae]
MASTDENGGHDAAPPRQLPDDLPRSLDDRRSTPQLASETEIYDAWQGQSQFISTPLPSKPLNFDLSLDGPTDPNPSIADSDSRLNEMLEQQSRLKHDSMNEGQEDSIIKDNSLSDQEKRDILQNSLNLAASNGDTLTIERFVSGNAKPFIDVNAPDADGTPPLIYAACFGHEEVVAVLLDAGAHVDIQDRNRWTPLMWAITNRHKAIAKLLLDKGAKPETASSSGRTAFDFVAPGSELQDYLHESGYTIGNIGVATSGDDFYTAGFDQDRFEEEMAENELRRRMMMESAINLEVDLGNLGIDEQPEEPEEFEEGQEFVWDRCLNDQMFVFQENELDRILDIVITNMTPTRSPSQKPVPANIIFLGARYAHYHSSEDLLEKLLVTSMDKINDAVEKHQWDMTMLAFWVSNLTLLLYYLKKDAGLVEASVEFQCQIAELINEIFVLIIRDAERRMDKVLDTAMLDHETIPGFEDVSFTGEWRIFKSKSKPKPPEPFEKRFRPPSPKRRAQVSPRNITSLLSSTLFVLDLYDIHSVITAQVLSQLLYWLGAELFNRIMSNRKYLARTKAMQIRMNVSTLEDWARQNNRQPEHFESGALTATGENTMDAARRHLDPVVQLLQWLQCFSSLGEDLDSLKATLEQLPRLTPQQINHSVRYYRSEVGEKTLPKPALKFLFNLQKEVAERRLSKQSRKSMPPQIPTEGSPTSPTTDRPMSPTPSLAPSLATVAYMAHDEEEDAPENLLMDPALMLPFSLPTSTDMLVTYGAGFGGTDKERERKYLPTVPPEFLEKLEFSSNKKDLYGDARWSDDGESA